VSIELRHAMLFAAGLGTRMLPLTRSTPKPLVKVAGKALLDHALECFAAAGVARVVVNTHHLADQLEAHVAAHPGSGPELCISHEDVLLETGGGIVKALPLLGGAPFVSANADAIWLDRGTPALARLAAAFDAEKMDALLLLHPLERAVGYSGPGNFALGDDGQLQRALYAPHVFTGVQVLHPRLFAGRKAEPWSLRELYNAAERADGRLARMYGLVHDGDWLHVGTPGELAEAESFLARR
jgi:MurNAc alpha-1-phosphate uridylyltransferase